LLRLALKTGVIFIFAFLQFLYFSAFAQDAHPTFKQYTVEDGLASSEVYQVKQDSKGYIWFATGNGVSRYNGYEFENFSMSNGLPDNTVFEIYEDTQERIWFVPISCKLSYYYKGKIYLFKYNDALKKAIKSFIKTSFCVDKNGTIFLGIGSGGIYEISKEGKITHHLEKDERERGLTVMEPIPSTYIYSNNSAATQHRVKFNTGIVKGDMMFAEDMSEIRSNARIIKTKNNEILISSNENLFIISGFNHYRVEKFPKRINYIYEDSDGDLWVGVYLGGVYYIPSYDFSHKQIYLADVSVDGIMQDKEKGFWFATEGNAVYYSPSKQFLTYDKDSKFKDNRTNCLATDDESIFVGLQNGFVHSISKTNELFATDCNYKGEYSNTISALFYDKNEKAVLVSSNIHCGQLKNKKFIDSKSMIMFHEMQVDENGTGWLACAYGLGKVNKNKKVDIIFDDLKDRKRINAVLFDKKGALLLGATDGLWKYNSTTGVCENLGKKDSLLQVRILDLKYAPDNLLIIATKGAGLLIYDGNRAYQINAKNGLCGDNVYRVCVDANTIWVATNKGLNKIVVSTIKPLIYEITSYTTFDGLASNEINDVLKFNDKIWVATNKGLTVFNPNKPTKANGFQPLYINHILINDKDTLVSDRYELPYNLNNIKINFIALGYKNAGKIKYRYKMLGISPEWNYTNSREIQFTTLPANEYVFILSALNSNGEWSIDEQKVDFLIDAPFWQKWWFISLCLFFLIGIVILIIRDRIKKAHLEEEKNMSLYKILMNSKLKALRAQMNPHFTFNVMNSIQHFIISKDEESASRYLSKFSKLIRSILNNSEKNTVTLSEEIKVLELYLDLEAMRFEKRFAYEIVVGKDLDPMTIEIPSMLIQPYIENAVKHGILPSTKQGRIKVEIKKEGAFLKCVIEDNGVGRLKASQKLNDGEHQSFGTSITQERLEVMNELYNSSLSEKIIDLYDENKNAMGTRVEIYIPLIKQINI
jgi:ligand-binding sensor domain-containing protein/two-component sensor histidine kinase